jgi:hypothetical protein
LLVAVFRDPLPFASPAVGVGHNPYSLPSVRSTNVGSGDNVPFAYVPDRGKRPQNSVERAASVMVEKADGIFRHKEPWAEIRNNSEGFAPHPSLIARTFLLACMAHWLARHACTDEVNMPISRIADRERPHVAPTGDAGPVLGQHAAGIGVDLDLPAAFHAGPLKAEVEAANPSEK